MIATDGRQTIANATGEGKGGAMLAPKRNALETLLVEEIISDFFAFQAAVCTGRKDCPCKRADAATAHVAPPRPLVDSLTYGVLVEHMPDGPVVRDRWPYLDRPRTEVVRKIVRYHADRGNRMEWRQGKIGAERLVMYAEDGIILAIDGSGVPAYYGRVAAYTEDES